MTQAFLNHFENEFLFKMDLEQNLFIMGDLNQVLLSSDGKLLIY